MKQRKDLNEMDKCLISMYEFIFNNNLHCFYPYGECEYLTFAFEIKENMSYSSLTKLEKSKMIAKEGYVLIQMTDIGPEVLYTKNLYLNEIEKLYDAKNHKEFVELLKELNNYVKFYRLSDKGNRTYQFDFLIVFQLLKYLITTGQEYCFRNIYSSRNILKSEYMPYKEDLIEKQIELILSISSPIKNNDKDNIFTFHIIKSREGFVKILVKIDNFGEYTSFTYRTSEDYTSLFDSRTNKSLIDGIMNNLIQNHYLPF